MTTLTRVAALERRCTTIEARLTVLEQPVDLTAIEQRLTLLEQTGPNPTADLTAFAERLTAIETQLDPITGSVLRDRPTTEA